MKKNNRGYISAISLLIMAFLLLLTGAVVPRVGAELNFTSINSDGVEAQYAAESGVKYAAAQILNDSDNTDWSWARGNQELTFADGETFKITIYPIDSSGKAGSSPIDDGVALTSGSKYLIQSVGKVNNYLKTVKVIAYINTGSASTPTIYSGKTLSASGSLTVANGDILAETVDLNGNVTINDKNKILYYKNASVPNYSNIATKKWSGEKYTYQPGESVVTSLPSFSAAANINGYIVNYTSGISFPSPNSTYEWRRYYTLSSNTKYYVQNTFLQSDNKPITINKEGSGDTYITVKGNYTTNNSGTNYINLNDAGNFVLNIIGNFQARDLVINATNASSVTINVTGNFTTSGSGLTIHGPANGNVNINVGADFSIGSGGLTIDGVNTGNINIMVDSDLTTDGYSWHISRPASGDVNILVNGNFSAKGAGLPITGSSTGTVNFFVGGTLTTQGSGIVINSTTGNVNIYANNNLNASGSGMSVDGANVNIVANGDISFSGSNSLRGDNVLLYAVGDGHDVEANSLYIEGVIIAPDGDITLKGGTVINNTNNNAGTGGSGSGTGTIEFSNWSS